MISFYGDGKVMVRFPFQKPVDGMGAECFLPRIINFGSATVTIGNTSVQVTHGCCGEIPSVIFLQALDGLGGRNAYPSNKTSTSFTLNISSQDVDDLSFYWLAIVE